MLTSKLNSNLKYLKLEQLGEELLLKHSKEINHDVIKVLEIVTDNEVERRYEKAKKQMLKTAAFPKVQSLDDFDFQFNESIDEIKIRYLASLCFVENSENIIFTGSPGVGKTHLSVAIAANAASERISTYFIKCKKLIDDLSNAQAENRLEIRLKHFAKYKVLVIDEIGFLPVNFNEAKLLFQLIDLRYEKKSTIITSNIPLEKWDGMFDDPVIAQAILDRLLHHSHIFRIVGESYRLKELS